MTKYERLYTADEVDGMIARAKAAALEHDRMEVLGLIKEALPEFQQQDDYLLAHGASLMSKDSHEIIHIDTAIRIARAAPPAAQRQWVGLTDERVKEIWLKGKDHGDDWLDVLALARSFEAELKELNT